MSSFETVYATEWSQCPQGNFEKLGDILDVKPGELVAGANAFLLAYLAHRQPQARILYCGAPGLSAADESIAQAQFTKLVSTGALAQRKTWQEVSGTINKCANILQSSNTFDHEARLKYQADLINPSGTVVIWDAHIPNDWAELHNNRRQRLYGYAGTDMRGQYIGIDYLKSLASSYFIAVQIVELPPARMSTKAEEIDILRNNPDAAAKYRTLVSNTITQGRFAHVFPNAVKTLAGDWEWDMPQMLLVMRGRKARQ